MLLIEFMNIRRHSSLFFWFRFHVFHIPHFSSRMQAQFICNKFKIYNHFAGCVPGELFIYQPISCGSGVRGGKLALMSITVALQPTFHVLHAEIKFNWENPYLLTAIGPGSGGHRYDDANGSKKALLIVYSTQIPASNAMLNIPK